MTITKLRALLIVGGGLAVLGFLLMNDSSFLLDPSGSVVCSLPSCYYYQHVYPIKRIEFFAGLSASIVGAFTLLYSARSIRSGPPHSIEAQPPS